VAGGVVAVVAAAADGDLMAVSDRQSIGVLPCTLVQIGVKLAETMTVAMSHSKTQHTWACFWLSLPPRRAAWPTLLVVERYAFSASSVNLICGWQAMRASAAPPWPSLSQAGTCLRAMTLGLHLCCKLLLMGLACS